jgi:hypothetical protein
LSLRFAEGRESDRYNDYLVRLLAHADMRLCVPSGVRDCA